MLHRILIIGLLFLAGQSAFSATAVQSYGALRVEGNQILNQSGTAIQLRGMSLYWSLSAWQNATKFWNASVVNWLADDWNANIIRAAMGVEPEGGYLSNAGAQKALVKTIVDAAIAKGIYVIIDWHDHYAHQHESQAIAFFEEMARTYGNKPNVIYEIYNEPKDDVTWETVKGYSTRVIDKIRAIDPDNLILVGNPTWDQDVRAVANSPITGKTNIAYTLHFYAGTHTAVLRNDGNYLLSKNLALFISEWGTTNSNGDGGPFTSESDTWLTWADSKKLSWCNWSVHDIPEKSAILNAGASATGNWSESNLSTSGKYVRGKMKVNPAANAYPTGTTPTSSAAIPKSSTPVVSSTPGYSSAAIPSSASATGFPGKIEAESHTSQSGLQLETTTDAGGGSNLSYIDNGDWAEYSITVSNAGTYSVDFRVASAGTATAKIEIRFNNNLVGTAQVQGTGGWQNWTTVTTSVNLTQGSGKLRLTFTGGGDGLMNLNWMNFSQTGRTLNSKLVSQLPTIVRSSDGFTFGPSVHFQKVQALGFLGNFVAEVDLSSEHPQFLKYQKNQPILLRAQRKSDHSWVNLPQ